MRRRGSYYGGQPEFQYSFKSQVPVANYVNPYYGGQPGFQYSFKSQVPVANYVNPGLRDGGRRLRLTWEMFLNGSLGLGFCSMRSALNPDYTYADIMPAVVDSIDFQINSGIGKLWSGVAPDFDSVAVLYSQRSVHGNHIIGEDWQQAHDGWFNALYDLGYSPKLMTSQELEEGELSPGKYKALVLPQIVSISGRQAKIIEDYVRQGGVVVCCSRAGIMDGHCKFAVPGVLDKLFGIRRDQFNVKGPAGRAAFGRKARGLDLGELTLNTSLAEGGLSAERGQFLAEVGGVPCVVINRWGKGKTCYLNLDVSKYVLGQRYAAAGRFIRGILERLLAWAGVSPKVHVEGEDVFFRIYRQRKGGNLYLGYVAPKDNESRSWRLDIGGKRHVYDCRKGEYLGQTDAIRALEEDRFRALYALLGYRVDDVKVTPERGEAAPGERVSVDVEIVPNAGQADRHGARVKVVGPDANEAAHYSKNILLRRGKGSFDLPFALNDVPGKWTVEVRDAATGVSGLSSILLNM